jgi:hypothetical protein
MGNYIKGHAGLLSIYDTAAYKPIVCLTSTSMERTAELTEKVNYCTQGETQSSVNSISRSLSLDGEYVELDNGETAKVTYDGLVEVMESKEERVFKIEGRGKDQYFRAIIASLSDTFPAGEDATFSGTLNINGRLTSIDPNA